MAKNSKKASAKRKIFSKGAAGIIPFFAAFGKAFGNSIGAINLFLFFSYSVIVSSQITSEMFNSPLWAVAGIGFAGVAFISIFMEGLSNWRLFYKLFKGEPLTKNNKNDAIQKPSTNNLFAKTLGFFFWPFTYIIPLAGALAKGATMAFGTYIILITLLADSAINTMLNNSLLGLAIACGFTIMLISLAKEGKDTQKLLKKKINKSLFNNDTQLDNVDKKTRDAAAIFTTWAIRIFLFPFTLTGYLLIKYCPKLSQAKKLNEFISLLPSILAGLGKGLGNAFGLIKIIGFGMDVDLLTNFSENIAIVLPIIITVALFEFVISITFEGNELRRHSQRGLNHLLNIKEKEIAIESKSGIGTILQNKIHKIPLFIRQITAVLIVTIPALAKGATMGFGALKFLEVLSKANVLPLPELESITTIFSTPVGLFIFTVIIVSSICVCAVSITKEGKEFYNWMTKLPKIKPVEKVELDIENKDKLEISLPNDLCLAENSSDVRLTQDSLVTTTSEDYSQDKQTALAMIKLHENDLSEVSTDPSICVELDIENRNRPEIFLPNDLFLAKNSFDVRPPQNSSITFKSKDQAQDEQAVVTMLRLNNNNSVDVNANQIF